MPVRSKAQARLMYASLQPNSNTGVPVDVARDYISSTPKSSFPKLAERLASQKIKNSVPNKKRNVR